MAEGATKLKLSFEIVFARLEQDIKKLKADLQASRQVEQELRSQVSSLSSAERGTRAEMGQLRQENELLQNKYVPPTLGPLPGSPGQGWGLQRGMIPLKAPQM